MRKGYKAVLLCLLAGAIFWSSGVMADRQQLKNRLVRLHVVANSDSREDQAVKLLVRDAVLACAGDALEEISDIHQAKECLRRNLPKLREAANRVLEQAGFEPDAAVSLCVEAFPARVYETFTLPAGVYDALRVTIGDGAGKNWWCVVYPSLCLPATATEFQDTAVEAGLSASLSSTLAGDDGYELRFFLLDAIGRLENLLLRD